MNKIALFSGFNNTLRLLGTKSPCTQTVQAYAAAPAIGATTKGAGGLGGKLGGSSNPKLTSILGTDVLASPRFLR